MGEKDLTGIYFCRHTNGHPDALDISELAAYAKGFDNVPEIWFSGEFILSDADQVATKIKERANVTPIMPLFIIGHHSTTN